MRSREIERRDKKRGEQWPQAPPAGEEPTATSTSLYKGTTLPHIVVKRTLELHPSGFVTLQPEKPAGGKFWPLLTTKL